MAFANTDVTSFEDLKAFDVRFLKIKTRKLPRYELYLFFEE